MELIEVVFLAIGFLLVAIQAGVAWKQIVLGREQSQTSHRQAEVSARQAEISAELLELERRRDQAVLQVTRMMGVSDRILEASIRNIGGRLGRLEYIMASWDGMPEDIDYRPEGTDVPMRIVGIPLTPVTWAESEKAWKQIEPPQIPVGEERKFFVALGPDQPGNVGRSGFPKWETPQLITFEPQPIVGLGERASMKVWWPRHDVWVREHNDRVANQRTQERSENA